MNRLDLYVCEDEHRHVVQRAEDAPRAATRPCASAGCEHAMRAANATLAWEALVNACERLALFADLDASSAARRGEELDAILELVHVAAEHVYADCDASGFPLTCPLPVGQLMPSLARAAETARSMLAPALSSTLSTGK